ncbi:MAG: GNAT family N-acetyltransferase [Geminicoccaceae bacterium]
MNIRDAVSSEFQELAWLQIRSWRDVYRGVMADWYLDDEIEKDLLTRWADLQPEGDDLILVADDGDIKGFVTIWCQPDPFIDNLHVEPGLRSKGIGSMLMQKTAARLIETGYDAVYLYVAAENQRAMAFYRKLGGRFGEVERYEHRHGEHVNAIKVTFDDLRALQNAGSEA